MPILQDRDRVLEILQAAQRLRHEQARFQRALEEALDLGERELADLIIERHAARLLRESRRSA